MTDVFGKALPRMLTEPPGSASRALADRLGRVESRNITSLEPVSPIFWAEARGANVRDVDGNVYVDLTSGFGVAAAGHSCPSVVRALGKQASMLAHGLGDVHPSEVRVRLLEKIAALTPGELSVTILGSAGAEAVEAALKTAALFTGRPGVIAFVDGYHGLTYGALSVTWRDEFRGPFTRQLHAGVGFAPFPSGSHASPDETVSTALREIGRLLDGMAASAPVGAVIVEPVQGRGGIRVAAPGFLPALRRFCDEHRLVLIFDEVYTGLGRTGRWFACEHEGVVPDILVLGKALTGALPLSAAVGTPGVMEAWPPSTGEAIHTSTFLGNPVACAAALAQLEAIERGRLVSRAARLGGHMRERLLRMSHPFIFERRGLGMMQGIELRDPATGAPATALASKVVDRALRHGVILLAEGGAGNVLAFTPPLVITGAQLDHALDVVTEVLLEQPADGGTFSDPGPAG